MKKFLFSILLFLFLAQAGQGCRYTVREIGFSTLAQSKYTLVIPPALMGENMAQLKNYQQLLRNSNIQLLVLDHVEDAEHPAIIAAKKEGIHPKRAFLHGPDGQIVILEEKSPEKLISVCLTSPLREQLINRFSEGFAYVLLIESMDDEKNAEAADHLLKNCISIENHMPNMPKQVNRGPELFRISKSQFKEEALLLAFLGIRDQPTEPKAFILYGRGRSIGSVMDFEAIQSDEAYKRMAMIGADCECGLDRKWMLGMQIPMDWPMITRQKLSDELGFDVDNPMVLAEMAHILSKEQIKGSETSISFAPKEIDLDELFLSSNPERKSPSNPINPANKILLFSLIVLIGLILSIGFYLFYRSRR